MATLAATSSRALFGVLLVITVLVAPSAFAQGFSGLGGLVEMAGIPDEDYFETRLEQADLRLGIVRLLPSLGVHDARFVTNSSIRINDPTDVGTRFEDPDFTATFVAGTRAYLRNGPHIVWAAHALPTYVWWSEDAERRRFNGQYGIGAFGHLRRLSFEVSERFNETQSLFDEERPELVTSRQNRRRLAMTYRFLRRFTISTSLADLRLRGGIGSDEAELSSFDRTQETTRVGFSYAMPIGVVLQLTRREVLNRFTPQARAFSSRESITSLGGRYRYRHIELQATLAEHQTRPRGNSVLTRRTNETGNLSVSWRIPRRVLARLSLRRGLRFALDRDFTRTITDRHQLQVTLRMRDLQISAGYGGGQNRFVPIAGSDLRRKDDIEFYEIGVSLPNLRWIAPSVSLRRWTFDSNIDLNDREVTTVGFGLRFKFRLPRIPASIPLPVDRLAFGSSELNASW